MTPERWQEIKRLFDAALACEPARRRSFLVEACQGDAALQQELESLLAAHERPEQESDVLGIRILVPGSHLGPYEILSLIGAGGMGEVYQARDTRLDRIVAIKVISPVVAGLPELPLRFEREARAVASLNHPHICTLHDIGSDEGVSFFVMEYLEGETLAKYLSRESFTREQVLQYGIQIAEALDAAHGHGVTHRDLKPANIMLTERGAKLLDFGLAKLTAPNDARAGDSEPLTTLGRTPGTLHYMAPEQLEGKDTDARTDIFAFGAVLYEMATRRKAFDGITPIGFPPLDRVVARCLARNPGDRWSSCQSLLAELRSIADTTVDGAPARRMLSLPGFSRRRALALAVSLLIVLGLAASFAYVQRPRGTIPESVAVLPFANATADPDLDYLSDGITDGLINSLSRIQSLRVAPRTLVSAYADHSADVQSIARSLDVEAVVSGRITRHDDTVTVAVELIDVQQRAQLWGAQYRSSPGDMLNVEKAIAVELAGRLQPDLTQFQSQQLIRRYADNPEAYQAYLRGRYHLRARTQEGYARSIEYFEQALARDPSYALAYAGLADAATSAGYFHVLAADDAYPRAKVAALRALELDDQLAEAHAALGSVMLLYEWDFPRAAERYERAIALDPRSSPARHGYSIYLASQGRLQDGIAEATRAEQLDPVSPSQVAHTGWILYFAREFDRAIERAQRSLELNAEFAGAHELLASAVLAKGLGVEELRQVLGRNEGLPSAQAQLAYVNAVRGNRRAKEVFLASQTPLLEEPSSHPVTLAVVYAAMGQRVHALEWLEKAYAMRQGQLIWLNISPNLDNLRAEPRFVDLVRRIGLPH